jgi:hypothetical protein
LNTLLCEELILRAEEKAAKQAEDLIANFRKENPESTKSVPASLF